MLARVLLGATLAALVGGCGAPETSQTQAAENLAALHEEGESYRLSPAYRAAATGALWRSADATRHPWPVTLLSIGHTPASYQNYGSAYFHHGIDMRADAGSAILASAGGKVVNIENYVQGNPAYWEVAILDEEGYVWQYHHVDRDSIPAAVHEAYESGSPIAAGTKLGEVYYWPQTAFGERYHHIHVNVLGQGDTFLSGFELLEPLADTKAPVFVEIGLLKNGRRHPGRSVSGRYSVFAQAHDLMLHDRFVVPPHELSFRLDGGEETRVWRFDTLPGGASSTQYVHEVFVPSMACGDYDCRRLPIDLGFRPSGRRAFPATRGEHRIEVIAKDYAGNVTTSSFTWQVQ